MNTHPIFGHMISGMMEAQRLQAPGMEPPRPSGCPSCAAAEAQCDRMAQRIRDLESALDLEARARVAAAEMAHEAKLALAEAKDAIQAALGNGADEAAWEPGEHWADAAARKIREARGARCTR